MDTGLVANSVATPLLARIFDRLKSLVPVLVCTLLT